MLDQFKKISYKPLHAGEERQHSPNVIGSVSGRTNDILLFNNPDRGYRTTMPVVILPVHLDPDDPTKAKDTCDLIIYDEKGKPILNHNSKCIGKHVIERLFQNISMKENERVLEYMFENWFFLTGKTDFKSKLILLQAQFEECNKDKKLPQKVLDIIDMFFDKCRERDCKVLFRYGYHMVQKSWRASEEGRTLQEKYGADEETMLAHIDQLVPFISKNKDIIHKLSSGFIGSGGEMAFGYQYPQVNYDNIVKAVVEKLCIPNNLYYTVRYPKIKLELLENDPDYKYAKFIGHNNDALWGETTNWGWCSGCYQYNHNFDVTGPGQCEEHDLGGKHIKNDWWEYVCQTSAYTPQSGEMYHSIAKNRPHQVPSGMDVIKELAHQHYTSLSQWNGFIESHFEFLKSDDGKMIPKVATMQHWINDQTVTPEILDAEGIIYDPAWFCDEEGKVVHRNPYEFIRDHLGYRISAKDLSAEVKNGVVKAELTLKNYGFAAAFNLESGFAVLDENYNVVSSVKAGEPEKWYSHDPDNYRSTEILEHNISADIELPTQSGKYYLAFYIKNTRDDFAKFANDMPFENGYNILHRIML